MMKEAIPIQLNRVFILWFTSLPCSGKTTVSKTLKEVLSFNNGVPLEVLDGDILRGSFSKDLGYSQKDRTIHNLRVAEKANEITKLGSPVCVALISPYQQTRRKKSLLAQV